jgi:hypothetical protein
MTRQEKRKAMMLKPRLVISITLLLFPLALASILSAQAKPFEPDLANVSTAKDAKVVNRAVSASDKDGKSGVRFDERPGVGLAMWPDVKFADGTIEFDVRGRDVFQQSFVGVAFHGAGDAYEAVYFRPFNFRAGDPERVSHSVQYVFEPTHSWARLRGEHPGQYEKAITPAPDPNSWVHARIVVAYPKVSVYVNNATEPSLVVEELSDHKSGWVGLWVGNGSGGDFANVNVSPATVTGSQQ